MAKNATSTAAPNHSAGVLTYVSDLTLGIRRRRSGKGFSYSWPDGRRVSNTERLRIKKLGIPPAYEDVWICPDPNGHIQATGRDARGRKQYRYHPLWSATQSETKYAELIGFGEALPAIRRRIARDLRGEAGDRNFSLAALILLLDQAHLRIGNPEYAAQNRSYGATTLLRRHLKFRDGAVRLSFRAKGGKPVQHILRDKRLHRILQQINDLPGRNLFTYLDEAGQPCSIGSAEVNAYLTQGTGLRLTAKTFRTWGGTLAAFEYARGVAADNPVTIRALAEAAAERLHNTPTICRKSYIHPAILDMGGMAPDKRNALLKDLTPVELPDLLEAERSLMSYLQKHAARGV